MTDAQHDSISYALCRLRQVRHVAQVALLGAIIVVCGALVPPAAAQTLDENHVTDADPGPIECNETPDYLAPEGADGVGYGTYYEVSLGYELDFFSYICQCQYDNPEILPGEGYESEQACRDRQMGEPERIDEIASCARQVVDDANDPPEWAEDVMACRIDNFQSARECLHDLDSEGDCSPSMLEQVRTCHIMTFGQGEGDDCDAYHEADGADAGWMTLVEAEIDSQCFEN